MATLKRLTRDTRKTKDKQPYYCVGISGFRAHGTNLDNTWHPIHNVFSDADLYALEWEAGNSFKIGITLGSALVNRKLLSLLPDRYKFSEPRENRNPNLIGIAETIIDNAPADFLEKTSKKLLDTWKKASKEAEKSGEKLAQEIKSGSLSKKPVVLIGINLGTEVIFSALRHLGNGNHIGKVVSVIFIGSTISCTGSQLSQARKAVNGNLINVFSKQDIFLKLLAFASDKSLLGLNEITGFVGISSVDMEKHSDHFKYASILENILVDKKIAVSVYKQLIEYRRHNNE